MPTGMRAAALLLTLAGMPRLTGGFVAVPILCGASAPADTRRAGPSALRLRAMLDKGVSAAASALNKIPLPTSPRIQDFDGGEVQTSLDRFLKLAPEGLKRTGKIVGDKVLPVATEMASDLLFKDYGKEEGGSGAASTAPSTPVAEDELPAGWTAHLDEDTGRRFYYELATQVAVWERPKAASPLSTAAAATTSSQTVEAPPGASRVAPDSSAELKEMQRLMQQSVADALPSPGADGDAFSSLESKSMSMPWDDDDDDNDDSPSWMIDSSDYNPK